MRQQQVEVYGGDYVSQWSVCNSVWNSKGSKTERQETHVERMTYSNSGKQIKTCTSAMAHPVFRGSVWS